MGKIMKIKISGEQPQKFFSMKVSDTYIHLIFENYFPDVLPARCVTHIPFTHATHSSSDVPTCAVRSVSIGVGGIGGRDTSGELVRAVGLEEGAAIEVGVGGEDASRINYERSLWTKWRCVTLNCIPQLKNACCIPSLY